MHLTVTTTALLALAFVVAMLVAVLVGTAAAYLARLDGATYPAAVTRGAAAFAATLTLVAALAGTAAALVA
ncbi:hypothetical protein ACH4E7_15165 [Kitasatospora sp. NPDC018058]|uniref:hypothetical protein n=1 Tax=Kitasatospora sp. NPDC018058 TaxID=3364025 RepID=UPI0037C14596